MDLVDAVRTWTKVSDHLYVHASGAKIERRGYPEPLGWYLVDVDSTRRFEPTAQGCDQAFIAFAGKRAYAAYLTRILRRAG